MSRILSVEVSDYVYGLLARQARDLGRGTKPEQVAEDWLGHRARESVDLARRFVDAGKEVDRRLAAGETDG